MGEAISNNLKSPLNIETEETGDIYDEDAGKDNTDNDVYVLLYDPIYVILYVVSALWFFLTVLVVFNCFCFFLPCSLCFPIGGIVACSLAIIVLLCVIFI